MIGITIVIYIAVSLLCLIIMGKYHTNVSMHNTLTHNGFMQKYYNAECIRNL